MTVTDLSLDYNPEEGNYTKTYQTRARRTLQGIFSSTLKGQHQAGDNWDIDWAGSFGHATGKRPDNTYINLESDVQHNVERVTADNAERRWEHNTDRDWTGLVNVKWHTRAAGGLWEAKAGGLYRNKRRENRYISYSFVPASATRPVQGVISIRWMKSIGKSTHRRAVSTRSTMTPARISAPPMPWAALRTAAGT